MAIPADPSSNSVFRSLPEVHQSVDIPHGKHWLRRWLAFAGPGFLVSVGYMDPGNWATDMAGGSKFGYKLLWVIFASNLMAQFLQILCAKLGLVTGKDLAMACRDYYKKPAAVAMWLLCEAAIIACDLAEVVGSAVALNLLFGLRLEVGVVLTGLDVLLLLGFMKFGFRKIEAIVFTLVMTVFGCFVYEIFLAKPDFGLIAQGTFIPQIPSVEALLISVGILGATVMPHNLYLHSSIVQTRKVDKHELEGSPDSMVPTETDYPRNRTAGELLTTNLEKLKSAIKYNKIDTIVALSLAFFVNAAILILAAAMFHRGGTVVDELQQGHKLLGTALGAGAATAFALALLASGQSSTITGTLAGQIVMEGFMKWRVAPWIRRLITRGLAVIPAVLIIHFSGGKDTVQLLILSQVVLSMQLPFAIFPLIAVTSDRKRMGEFANSPFVKILGYTIGTVIVGLNVYLLWQQLGPLFVGVVALLVLGFGAYVRYVWKERPAASA